MQLNTVKKYYDDITSTPIESVATHLLKNRIVERQRTTYQCDCPNHASVSKRSMHISLDKQSWYCFGCGVGGDVLHLVEFVHNGCVSHTVTGTHRDARDWLATFANMPSLSSLSISAERQEQGEASVQQTKRTGEVMRQVLTYYHLQMFGVETSESETAKSFFFGNYAIASGTAQRLLIGYMPVESGKAVARKLEAFLNKKGITSIEMLSTGLFRVGQNDELVQSFPGRILFPYWSRGLPRFAIARKTPCTPNNEYEQGKYKKLPVKDERRNSHICESIDNRLLYNEDCLSGKPDEVIITEGITDCIALEERGYATLSPVTVTISAKDWDRIIPKLRDVNTVYLCLDNEVSNVGLKAAKKAASKLGEQNIDARIITIPLREKQRSARKKLLDIFNISDTGLSPKEKKKIINGLEGNSKQLDLLESLLHLSKSDPNEFFLMGGTTEQLDTAKDEARCMVDFEIENIQVFYSENKKSITSSKTKSERELNSKLENQIERLMVTLAAVKPIVQEGKIKVLAGIFKGKYSRGALTAQLTAAKKESKDSKEKSSTPISDRLIQALRVEGPVGNSNNPGSVNNGNSGNSKASDTAGVDSPVGGDCLSSIREAEAKARSADNPFNAVMMGETIADWIESNGGKFFYYPSNESCLFFDNKFYHMDSFSKGDKRKFRQFLYRMTGLVDTTTDGRTVIETLANTAHKRGVLRKPLTWLHTDTSSCIVYFAHNCESSHILKISPNKVEEIKNGVNEDEILLSTTEKIKPFVFHSSVNVLDGAKILERIICPAMACSKEESHFIMLWCSCFLLIDFVSTKPATRFEGDSASGKTTAAKIITTLLYGSQQQKRSTDAANYYDGANNPLVCLDNIESKQMTDGLTQFILTSVTGISNEKRQMGSDSGVISETSKCLINTTGIEALSGELSEIQNRTFTFNFSAKHHSNNNDSPFVEIDLLNSIKENRDILLSSILVCTARVLSVINSGGISRNIKTIIGNVGKHEKSRCNDYLSLMIMMEKELFLNSDDGDDNAKPTTIFKSIKNIEKSSRKTKTDTNPIVHALDMLLSSFENCADVYGPAITHIDELKIKYQVNYDYLDGALNNLTAKQLFVACSKIFRDSGMRWPYGNARILAQRIVNDSATIKDSGLKIEKKRVSQNHPVKYEISRIERVLPRESDAANEY